ncbi:MAG TPA: VOC family protein [Nocardioidaceae bacterium]|nr:VOC family protein [Nocardioidaceae bacterium]
MDGVDLFAGIAVSEYALALDWYERLLGAPPSFHPNDVEAVWEVTDHGYLYVEHLPERAGKAMVTLFVSDLAERVAGISARGIEPVHQETYENGVRKVLYRDPDGNEIGLGGGQETPS